MPLIGRHRGVKSVEGARCKGVRRGVQSVRDVLCQRHGEREVVAV